MERFTYSCNLAPASVAGTVLTGSSIDLAEKFETSLPLELRTKRLHHKLDQMGTNIDIKYLKRDGLLSRWAKSRKCFIRLSNNYEKKKNTVTRMLLNKEI